MSTTRSLLPLLFAIALVSCKTQLPATLSQQAPVTFDQPTSVDVRGEALHYIEYGAGDPLIFIHGTIGDYRAWISRMQPYGENYHVVSYSRRYAWPNQQVFDSLADYSVRIHADDLYALIQELGFKKVHLVGHSYGAFTALTMALDHPELVRSLVLGEPPATSLVDASEKGRISRESFLDNNLRPAAQAFRADEVEMGLELFVQGVNGPDFRLADVPPEMKQGWMDNLLELWGSVLTESFLTLDPSRVKELEIPVLLLVGDQSPVWLVEISRELHRLLPQSRLVNIANSSHGLYFANPEAVDQAVRAFLKRY